MRLSKEGFEQIKKHEGWRNHPYRDTAGVATIGYGFTYYLDGTRVQMTDAPMTRQDGDALLKDLICEYEDIVNRRVTQPLNQNQFDALVSFCYNLGETNFKNSTLLKKINVDPCDPSIEDEFRKWVYAGGVKSKGLKKRRNREAYLYFS